MSEEKKDDPQEQQDFLSSHEELLNSINKGKKTEEQPVEKVAKTEPVAESDPIPESEPTPEPEPISEPAKEPEPVSAPEPKPVVAPKPASKAQPVKKPAKTAPSVKTGKKKKKEHEPHTERNEEEKRRHEELLKQQALEQSEVTEVLKFFKKYAKPTAVVVLGICAIFLVSGLMRANRLKKDAQADSALIRARTASEFQQILDEYESTPSAPLALMGLAQENFNSGNVAEANALYSDFIRDYPKHEMAMQAAFNKITCEEAEGKLSEAHIHYGEFAETHKDTHLAPVALIQKARCLETLELFAEAKLIYEDIITFYPNSGWSQTAESNLSVVQSKLK